MSTRQHDRYIAHVKQSASGEWLAPHELKHHLQKVADLSGKYARCLNSEAWATAAGQWHDLGKYRPPFQAYIRRASGFERENAHIEQDKRPARVTHSTAGAKHAIEQWPSVPGYILAYLISGHHAGLPDWSGGPGALQFRLAEAEQEYREALSAGPPANLLSAKPPPAPKMAQNRDSIALWMRVLFSCLVDADFLDTERYMSPEKNGNREAYSTLDELYHPFFDKMARLQSEAESTELNEIRKAIFQSCRKMADKPAGIFSLTVPTGGGKTLASLGFGLEHAKAHGKQRIIYAIPFTSIIEQNASVFRDFLGDGAVVEHHSSLDVNPNSENAASRLATENWDAPLIVTTNVQLFESLFASRTSRCRKLHNLVNSIVILDEAQQIPRDFHEPITRAMQQMSDYLGVTWVLCTATQPELGEQKDTFGRELHKGLRDVREIIEDPDELAQQLKRVTVEMPAIPDVPTPWEALADKVAAEECCLVIVNKRRDARTLYEQLPHNGHAYHLSANMCAEHRSIILRKIRKQLEARLLGDPTPLRVISTQLIEAGVDVDFPVVFRAMAGLDSIAQAAGRCNREGKMEQKGRVIVFQPEELPPPGFLRQAAQTTLELLKSGQLDEPLSPRAIQAFFTKLNSRGDRDVHKICDLLRAKSSPDAPLEIQFREAAGKFRLIDDRGIGVIVPFCPEGMEESPVHTWLNALEKDGSAKWVYRKLQRYSVTLPETFAQKLLGIGALYQQAGQFVVESSHYHPTWGVQAPDSLLTAEASVI
jgi:CRISPR-associated endonuclease/helicase Cas3